MPASALAATPVLAAAPSRAEAPALAAMPAVAAALLKAAMAAAALVVELLPGPLVWTRPQGGRLPQLGLYDKLRCLRFSERLQCEP